MKEQFIKILPTILSLRETKFALAGIGNSFYDFKFSNGFSVESKDRSANIFHETRAELVFPFLDALYKNRWQEKRCLDLACHQGWFTCQLAVRGASEVIGIDIRHEHLEIANKVKAVTGFENIQYEIKNLFDLDVSNYGEFDLVFMLGLLYHLDNPLGALKIARSLTKEYCIIETQVARGAQKTECKWGSSTDLKEGDCIAIINADEFHAEKNNAVALVPTLNALYRMLHAVGFDRLYLCVPPNTMYEQYADFDRVIIIAQVL